MHQILSEGLPVKSGDRNPTGDRRDRKQELPYCSRGLQECGVKTKQKHLFSVLDSPETSKDCV